MALIKCPHCGRTVPAAKLKCPKCGKSTRYKASFWRQFGVSGSGYILILILGCYFIGTNNNWGWVIGVAGFFLLGLRLLRIMATKK